MSARQVIDRLTSTATDIGKPGRDDECGFGLLNIVKALTADLPADTAPTAEPSAEPTPTEGDAAPEPEDSGVNVAKILGSAVGVLAVLGVGALIVLLVRPRRRS